MDSYVFCYNTNYMDAQTLLAAGRNLMTHWMPHEFWLTRFVFVRCIGAIYFVAFLSMFNQFVPLIGSKGLLPARRFLQSVGDRETGSLGAFFRMPTLFWFNASDRFMMTLCTLGLALSFMVMMGLSNGVSLLLLWVIYLSFVHVGQVFYGFGWESMLLETGFLAIFIYPFWGVEWFPGHHPPPKIIMVLILWMLFRVMFGAGLIKMRGHPCWRNLSCLFYHFETQPIPNPLSRFFHHLPHFLLRGGVLVNHVAELFVPFLLFATSPMRVAAGLFTIAFQLILILSGNLSWLNWLTIVLCIPCFDDRFLGHILPGVITSKVPDQVALVSVQGWTQGVLIALPCLVLVLSIKPIVNLFSSRQAMNASYDPFHLVNTYGAFGHVGEVRHEVILQGTNDEVLTSDTLWLDYEFKAKPGDVNRRPPIISPYHYRLDWQIWFAAMSPYHHHPWLMHLVYKLLKNDQALLKLIYRNPFPELAPKFIRIELYDYRFTPKGDRTGAWWQRDRIGSYLPALDLENESFKRFLNGYNWVE